MKDIDEDGDDNSVRFNVYDHFFCSAVPHWPGKRMLLIVWVKMFDHLRYRLSEIALEMG